MTSKISTLAPGNVSRRPVWVLVVFTAAALLLGGCGGVREKKHGRLVLLVVMDTVRRDYVEPCGAKMPVTPNLRHLAERGTTFCGMIAPGSWTLPVHASIFTGSLPVEHGADLLETGKTVPGIGFVRIQPLGPRLPTLAEQFKRAGYQTALVSTNSVLNPATGLARGFEWVNVSSYPPGRAALAYPQVESLLDNGHLDASRPLFLMVNIIVAHSPYEAVPRGVDWLRPTSGPIRISYDPSKKGILYDYYNHLMGENERGFLSQLRANYAWGVHLADEGLGGIQEVLRSHGWLRDDSIVAVTADHGELLGEHGELEHGRSVDPEVLDVFAILRGPGFDAGVRRDVVTQSQDLYPTLLDAAGILATSMPAHAVDLKNASSSRIAISTSEKDPLWMTLTGGKGGTARLVAAQTRDERVVWSSVSGFSGDYGEQPDSPLEEVVAQVASHSLPVAAGEMQMSEDLRSQLKALGYVN